jgi:hypothetical protein
MALSFGGTMDESSIQTEMENGSSAALTLVNPTLHTFIINRSSQSFGTKVNSMSYRIKRRRLHGLFIFLAVAHAFVRVEAISSGRSDALNSRRNLKQKSSPDIIQRKQNQRRLPKRSSGEL